MIHNILINSNYWCKYRMKIVSLKNISNDISFLRKGIVLLFLFPQKKNWLCFEKKMGSTCKWIQVTKWIYTVKFSGYFHFIRDSESQEGFSRYFYYHRLFVSWKFNLFFKRTRCWSFLLKWKFKNALIFSWNSNVRISQGIKFSLKNLFL